MDHNQLRFDVDFIWEIRRADGTLRANGTGRNRIVNTGLNAVLDAIRGTTFPASLAIGLIDKTSYSAIAAADTMSSHAGWIEFTGYSESTRRAWSPAAAASQEIGGNTTLTFTGSTLGTIKGIFVVGGTGSTTKGATTGTLIAAGTLSSEQQLPPGETMTLTYRIQASSGA